MAAMPECMGEAAAGSVECFAGTERGCQVAERLGTHRGADHIGEIEADAFKVDGEELLSAVGEISRGELVIAGAEGHGGEAVDPFFPHSPSAGYDPLTTSEPKK